MTDILEGRKLADQRIARMATWIQDRGVAPRLVAITADPDVPTQQFLRIKERVASRIGAKMRVVSFESTVTEDDIVLELARATQSEESIVLQLPLPPHISLPPLLTHIPRALDPDCIGVEASEYLKKGNFSIIHPVVSAIRSVVQERGFTLRGARAVVVGHGRLVGAPGALWLQGEGAEVTVLTRENDHDLAPLMDADIVILGAGVPGLVKPHMLKKGVMLFDAGTSEAGGKVVGDADPLCASVTSLFTPVPGGIGPLAVSELFLNVLRLQFDYTDEA